MIIVKLVAYCIGLTDQEIETLKSIKNTAGVRITSSNHVTTVKGFGIYDDLLEYVVAITKFKTFEVHLD